MYSTVKILQFDRSQKYVATILRNWRNLTRGLGGHFVFIKFDPFPGAGNMGTFKRGYETLSGSQNFKKYVLAISGGYCPSIPIC